MSDRGNMATKTCPICKVKFSKPYNIGKPTWRKRIHCSNSCSNRARTPYYNDPEARCKYFLAKARITVSGCIEFQGERGGGGEYYGCVHISGIRWIISRAIYHFLIANIPKGMQVLHRCDNPSCINLDHLFLGTHKDNMQDKISKGRGRAHGKLSPDKKLIHRILSKVKEGTAYKEISAKLGISTGTISQLATKNGLRQRRSK